MVKTSKFLVYTCTHLKGVLPGAEIIYLFIQLKYIRQKKDKSVWPIKTSARCVGEFLFALPLEINYFQTLKLFTNIMDVQQLFHYGLNTNSTNYRLCLTYLQTFEIFFFMKHSPIFYWIVRFFSHWILGVLFIFLILIVN